LTPGQLSERGEGGSEEVSADKRTGLQTKTACRDEVSERRPNRFAPTNTRGLADVHAEVRKKNEKIRNF